ncbi:DUF3631 domain-containing protein [Mycolicibacterium litorale]|uniref:DUF3631 domain-containing protein n=1 Tax=Mycolicibacterium litorale TaxID=758802 RepID=UPI003CEAC371
MADLMVQPVSTGVHDSTGAGLLDEVREVIRRFCVLPGEHELHAVVLWCALTHLVGEFDYAPRLVIRSAEKRSGKSRLLEIVDGLVHAPLRAVNASVAYVFRSLGFDPPPTLLFDEVDTIFGSKRAADKNEDLRGLLNAGFQRGLPFGRVSGSDLKPQEFSTFAMAALAGIGQMPETIEDRAVVVVMKRRKDTDIVEPFRIRRDGMALEALRDRLAAWADAVRDVAGATYPDIPVDDRAADVWEPLIAVADLAGGEWPQLARDAAVALTLSAAERDTSRSPGLQLLADIRSVFDTGTMKSQDLCDKLRALPDSPYEEMDLTPPKLGKRLSEYTIQTRHAPDKASRVYYRTDFTDAFARYLPAEEPSHRVHPVRNGITLGAEGATAVRCASGSATKGAGPYIDENQPPVEGVSTLLLPDMVDTFGQGAEGRDFPPTPALMPKRRDAVTAVSGERRKRRRARGRRSARPEC